MSKTVGSTTTSHIWDGANIAADVMGGTVTKYIRGVQLISSKKGSTESFYNYNGHGDVVQLTNSSGTVTKQYSYDAFGNEMNKTDSDTNPFRYCGEYYDKENDSIYLRARYYKPNIGRFITEDPVKDDLNWYVYCGNEPVMMWDPSGLYTLGTRMALSEMLRIGNVEEKDTGLYGSLRDMCNIFGSDGSEGAGELIWEECGEGAVVTYTFPRKNHPYTMRITFDSVKAGEYASKVEYFYLGLNITNAMTNSVRDKFTEQNAYFYLKVDENNKDALVVQTKILTMFDAVGQKQAGRTYEGTWIYALDLQKVTGAPLQDCLDFLANENLLNADYQAPPPDIRDYFPDWEWYDD